MGSLFWYLYFKLHPFSHHHMVVVQELGDRDRWLLNE